jgi:cell division protein FtsB
VTRAVIPSGLLVVAAFLLSLAATQSTANTPPAAISWQWLIEWLRIIGGLLGMVAGGVGIWAYFRVSSRQKTEQAQARALTIYKEQIDALEARMQTMADDHTAQRVQMEARERELITLRARTDLSEVLKCSQVMTQSLTDLIAEGRKHDTTITAVLRDAVTTGQHQYRDVMELMNKMLTYLTDTSKENLGQTQKNYALIEVVVKSMNNLSRRFGTVEDAVADVAEQVGVDMSPPDKEPVDRRKKERPA